ncbi:hypothetical protein OAO19_02970 [Gammaproteobacteria bacterium]|nr:hypothetical protein [Gammaproteobacteria bacterium]
MPIDRNTLAAISGAQASEGMANLGSAIERAAAFREKQAQNASMRELNSIRMQGARQDIELKNWEHLQNISEATYEKGKQTLEKQARGITMPEEGAAPDEYYKRAWDLEKGGYTEGAEFLREKGDLLSAGETVDLTGKTKEYKLTIEFDDALRNFNKDPSERNRRLLTSAAEFLNKAKEREGETALAKAQRELRLAESLGDQQRIELAKTQVATAQTQSQAARGEAEAKIEDRALNIASDALGFDSDDAGVVVPLNYTELVEPLVSGFEKRNVPREQQLKELNERFTLVSPFMGDDYIMPNYVKKIGSYWFDMSTTPQTNLGTENPYEP